MTQSTDPLGMSSEDMRKAGYRLVDLLVEATTDWSMPPIRRATPKAMREALREPAPAAPVGLDAALDRLFTGVVPHLARLDHPRYMAFIPCSGTWPGALGDFAASALNVYVASWLEAAGPTELELTVLDWFKEWIGYPAEADGQLTSGGSVANLQALACARELRAGAMRDDLVLYVSDQSHSSVARAARALGFRSDRVRILPSDRELRLRPEMLEAAIDVDRARGLVPLAASVTAGSTSTGVVDPLSELADVCASRDVWLHVDAAWGGFAALTERGSLALAGLERADSVTIDPHKWLFQPYECGCVLVREPDGLRRAFEVAPPYLKDIHLDRDEVNLADRGLQLSRTSRAFKVWLSVQTFGLDAFRAAVDRVFDHVEHAVTRIAEHPELELACPPSLGIVCFHRNFPRAADEAERARLGARLLLDLEAAGIGFLSSTTLRGRYVIRLCPLNRATERFHIDEVVDFLARHEPGGEPATERPASRGDDIAWSWLRPPEAHDGVPATPEVVLSVPFFGDLAPDDARRVAELATVVELGKDDVVIEEWDVGREFFVVLAGEIRVERDGITLQSLGPGTLFGEIAAGDWGRGYGYARTATCTAASAASLLRFPEGTLPALTRVSSGLEQAFEQAMTERFPV